MTRLAPKTINNVPMTSLGVTRSRSPSMKYARHVVNKGCVATSGSTITMGPRSRASKRQKCPMAPNIPAPVKNR